MNSESWKRLRERNVTECPHAKEIETLAKSNTMEELESISSEQKQVLEEAEEVMMTSMDGAMARADEVQEEAVESHNALI